MPCEFKRVEKPEEKYSALSLLKILITWLNWFLISLRNAQRYSNV